MSQEVPSTVIHDSYVKFLNTVDYYLEDEEDDFYSSFDNDVVEVSPEIEAALLEVLDILLLESNNDVELAVAKCEAWFKRFAVAMAKTLKATGYVIDAQPLNDSEYNEYNALLANLKTNLVNLGIENVLQEANVSLADVLQGLSEFSTDFSQILRETITQRAQETMATAPKLSKPRPRP